MTVILIAHRLSTVKRADKICVIRGGKVGRAASSITVGGKGVCNRRLIVAIGNIELLLCFDSISA